MTNTLTDAQSLTIADALTHTLTASDRRQRRIGDALFPHQPDRALLTSSPLAVVAESDRSRGHAFS